MDSAQRTSPTLKLIYGPTISEQEAYIGGNFNKFFKNPDNIK